ncbi:hypothetical protein KDA_54340 [Dictyobacter alpinus]|uniref:Uncharacterized protein n=1 Tax=Dictyobacter alpinus TaxID=2014873 RepID=A0A402BF88_9CHLR|nr:hypothetical protein [Dictyobacter alpinus]GCE29950.1 hypothetical protein KDA_54340 [Dictyobacter alpinus]
MSLWLLLFGIILPGILLLSELFMGLYCAVVAIYLFLQNRRERRTLHNLSWQEQQRARLPRKGGSATFFFAMGAVWLLVAALFLSVLPANLAYANAFQPGRCTIISMRLQHEKITKTIGSHDTYNSDTGKWETVDDTIEVPGYRPYYQVNLSTAQGNTRVEGPDVYQSAAEDAKTLKQYQTGENYRCWYYTLDAQQITFNEPPRSDLNWFIFLIPATITGLLGATFTFLAFRSRRKARIQRG